MLNTNFIVMYLCQYQSKIIFLFFSKLLLNRPKKLKTVVNTIKQYNSLRIYLPAYWEDCMHAYTINEKQEIIFIVTTKIKTEMQILNRYINIVNLTNDYFVSSEWVSSLKSNSLL